MGKKNNLIGQKFDRLKVIEEVQRRYSKGGKSIRRWLCECECGNKNVIVDGQLLTDFNEAVDIRVEYEKKIFGEYQYKGESDLISNGGDSP